MGEIGFTVVTAKGDIASIIACVLSAPPTGVLVSRLGATGLVKERGIRAKLSMGVLYAVGLGGEIPTPSERFGVVSKDIAIFFWNEY